MANWNFKNLDTIAATCKIYSRNPAIPDASRKSFAQAFELSNGLKRSIHAVTSEQVDWAFNLMHDACKGTRACECQNSIGTKISDCPLIRESWR